MTTVLAIVGALTLTLSCGDSGTEPVQPPPDPVATTVMVAPVSAQLTHIGETVQLVAQVLDAGGGVIAGAPVAWSSSDASVASVDGSGLVTAAGNGSATVTATSGGASGSTAVSVAQAPERVAVTPAEVSLTAIGDTARFAAEAFDALGHAIAGAPVAWSSSDASVASVDGSGLVTAAGNGSATVTATSGGASGSAAVKVTCILPELDLELGRPILLEPNQVSCGISIRALTEGSYYRVTLVGVSEQWVPLHSVSLSVTETIHPTRVPTILVAPQESVGGLSGEPHPGRYDMDRKVLSWITADNGPRPLPDLRGTVLPQQQEPSLTREFTRGRAGTLADNCSVHERRTGVRLGFNEHMVIYADQSLSSPPTKSDADVVLRHYRDFGHQVVEAYFGGVGDIDGDRRIVVFVQDDLTDVGAVVWLGDQLSSEDCTSSNQSELMRLSDEYFGAKFFATGTVVHEAKHISSHGQVIRRAVEGGYSPWDSAHPDWVEEGTAEIAREVSARLAWESLGGPPTNARITQRDIWGWRSQMWTPEVNGLRIVLLGYGQIIASGGEFDLHSHSYGAGWGFSRFIGDVFGDAAVSRFGDATVFAKLNSADVPLGVDGLELVTGRSFEELMTQYAQSVSLAATGLRPVKGTPHFTTYDFTGLVRHVGSPFIGLPTVPFPYPVTTTTNGSTTRIWHPLGEPSVIKGTISATGMRVHDFRAERARDKATISFEVPEHVRVVVVKIPDQRR